MGHMVIGVEMVQARISKIKNFPGETGVRLKHLILSHHGRYEFGAPSLPMLHEAFILNFIDDMDAKINYMERLSSQVKEEGYQWSEYQRNLERFLFLRGHKEQEESQPEPKVKDEVPRPPTLWDLPAKTK
jgi:3'-5' exoribonuclease